MQLGMIGLGRMGANIVRRLMRDGHTCVVYDVTPTRRGARRRGRDGREPARRLRRQARRPRRAWIMVPAGEITEKTVSALGALLDEGDTIIDGGNSYYRDDIRRAAELGERGIDYVDCGTSGGVFGLDRGFCLMVGGPEEAFAALEPIFAALAPGLDAAERTPGRNGDPAPEERGYLHCGPAGAGHFVKMVHNGIEYALMASFAEGLNILHRANAGLRPRDRTPRPRRSTTRVYAYALDVPAISEVWRRGSVVESWLLDLTAAALQESPELEGFTGRVSDSGEGRWTAIAAIEEGVPADVLTAALYSRFSSRDEGHFANRCCRRCASSSAATTRSPRRSARRAAVGAGVPDVVGSTPGSARELAELGRGQRLARRVEIPGVDEHLARPPRVRDAVPPARAHVRDPMIAEDALGPQERADHVGRHLVGAIVTLTGSSIAHPLFSGRP